MARPRQVSDEEILDAARRCFLEQGPRVSTTVIAKEVGLSQAALFKRFGTKKELLLSALAPPARPPFIDRLEQGPDERPIPEQVVEIGLAILAFLAEVLPRANCLRAAGVEPEILLQRYRVPPPLLARIHLIRFFQTCVDTGRMRETDPETMAMALMGSLHSRVFLHLILQIPRTDDDDRAYLEGLMDVIWNGARPEDDR